LITRLKVKYFLSIILSILSLRGEKSKYIKNNKKKKNSSRLLSNSASGNLFYKIEVIFIYSVETSYFWVSHRGNICDSDTIYHRHYDRRCRMFPAEYSCFDTLRSFLRSTIVSLLRMTTRVRSLRFSLSFSMRTFM